MTCVISSDFSRVCPKGNCRRSQELSSTKDEILEVGYETNLLSFPLSGRNDSKFVNPSLIHLYEIKDEISIDNKRNFKNFDFTWLVLSFSV